MASSPLPPLSESTPFMHFRRMMTLHGPNIWSRRQCIEVWVDLGPLKDWSSELIPGFNERYKAWLPTVIEHRCSVGERGGFFSRLDDGTYLAHILEHTSLELQTLAGCDVGFGRAREMSEEGVYKVAIRYEEESIGKECLLVGRELLRACVYDMPFDVAAAVARLKDMADRRCLGPSTKAIIAAAQQRNIPFRRLNMGSLVVLGQGCNQRRIWTAETDETSAIAESIAQDKQLTKRLLSCVGVPTPEGRAVASADDAVTAATEIGCAVVVKPRDGNHGRGVVPQLTKPDEIRRAFDVAAREGSGVLVERFVPGDEHRLLVVGNRMIAAARGEPITVQADGIHTVQELIQLVVNSDPRRGEDESQPLSPVEIDDALRLVLEQQKLTLESVPKSGVSVLVKRHDNLSMDVTDSVHPSVADHAVRAVQMIGLDIAGVDLVATDISRPLLEQGGAIVEVNAGPGLLMHIKPSLGSPQPVGKAIIDHIFPIDAESRIPIITVMGTNHSVSVVRLLKQQLIDHGHCTAWSDGSGLHVNETPLDRKIASAADCLRRLQLNPQVTAGVVAMSPESILTEGMEYDRGLVAIVTDIDWEKYIGGEFDLHSREKVFGVFRSTVDVILPGGTAILNADDAMALEMKPLSHASVILFSCDPQSTAILQHRDEGKPVVVCVGNSIQFWIGDEVEILVDTVDAHLGPTIAIESLLAASAAAWHLGLGASRQSASVQVRRY